MSLTLTCGLFRVRLDKIFSHHLLEGEGQWEVLVTHLEEGRCREGMDNHHNKFQVH